MMKCTNCKHAKLVYGTGGWSFRACYCEPYKGKWVAEIKECPLPTEIEEMNLITKKVTLELDEYKKLQKKANKAEELETQNRECLLLLQESKNELTKLFDRCGDLHTAELIFQIEAIVGVE